MSNIQRYINKASKALRAKGKMPLIKCDPFYGDSGEIVNKYIIHYGDSNPRHKNNDIVKICYGKKDLLDTLVKLLKAGDG